MLTIDIALISLFAGLGSCIPNVYPAECSPAAGDAHWTPPASSSILLKRENAVADKTDVMVPDSSMLTALLASGGAMTTSTDNAVFTFSHANTMESGSDNGHSTARARNAVDLYKHHGLSRLRKRGMRPIGMVPNGMVSNYGSAYTPSETPKKSVRSITMDIIAIAVFFAVTLIAALTLKCWGSCHHASDVEPPGPAMGYPVIAPIMTAQLRNQADQIDLAVMPLSPIRPDISTLGNTLVERRTTANNGDNTLSSVPPSRSVASDSSGSGRRLTDRN
ncbi:hypothetical protein SeMB42_g07045 [Synchytrium endobioticum]|uniref:Uncharacterized protein n=1 Tax=Synchytrium endobioticum TaxID=286115 RepID=A0A507C6Y1_9FUNG|nr:hypothetical protein SeMB42_g07045 [Synchytrium endobioticum]